MFSRFHELITIMYKIVANGLNTILRTNPNTAREKVPLEYKNDGTNINTTKV